jgi:hypothetical protein
MVVRIAKISLILVLGLVEVQEGTSRTFDTMKVDL